MDAKPNKLYLVLMFILGLATACQKKEIKAPVIVDDGNSQYAGKSCYGNSKSNQFILRWSDGSLSIYRGNKIELQAQLDLQPSAENMKRVVFVEQDREIHFEAPLFDAGGESVESLDKGIFWQVWGQEDMQADLLWEQNIKGNGVTVAVIDGAVNLDHPSLQNQIAINENELPDNGIDDDQNGIIDDYKGFDFAKKQPKATPSDHGTHVAGIIAAEPKNSPMAGVAPESKILPLNIMEETGGGTLSSAVFAIKYAQSRGARVINASWGGALCADILKEMIKEVGEQGVLFVAAAGNEGLDIEVFPEFPASFPLFNQITVGASMPSGLMAGFSNYSRSLVHVLAPGHQILSSVSEGWYPASGTSMAAPFVSGLAALLWSARPQASLEMVKKSIIHSVVAPKEYNPVVGQGRINAPQALQKLDGYLSETPQN